jgi:hypothetical protein
MSKVLKDEVIREFPPIGKYRIRLLSGKEGQRVLDIREYVTGETFEGFTRRGVRLAEADVELLRKMVDEIVSSKLMETKKGGDAS